ncbi:glycoside hydrolase family 15 protein [Aquimarina intermedia]|uniref:GH15 family glucan-1,4-alpha-glucosidase n=1 Tax=Aquimarina intermedia TaxID=350814 RepID=A0A5S5BZM7_9FLAO|nr:glycoside hydrolase family 15 protein [Aquimarina intermedia]TYP71666.1 GH15 family glucan-1,4-alpha-glucosidase [Aquimarina intermedia]
MNNLDYGIIGNCKSAALISKYGSLDWCCLPNFDSYSVFAKILDEKIGGSFSIEVGDDYTISQKYIHKTNILVTEFSNGTDVFECIDFMPRYKNEDGSFYAPPDVIRYIKLISGTPKFTPHYHPKLEYALGVTEFEVADEYIKSINNEDKYDTLYLYSNFNLQGVHDSQEIELREHGYFVISYHEKILTQSLERCYLKLQRTRVYWLNWSENTTEYKYYNDQILRSALVLKLLSYDKSGAVLAAATTSLPETIGEVRNWDYRFCWIRDASMVIKVVSNLGHKRLAQRFLQFIIDIIPDKDEKIQIMYGINGEKDLTEKTLDHLSGYQNSKPVRIGNAAYHQKQNDIYGILMDVIYQQFAEFECDLDNSEGLWTICKSIVHIVNVNWEKADKGIWEFRTEERHFTFSKLLCWVAIDRAIKIGKLINKPKTNPRWVALRDRIYEDIYENAWNEDIQAYTQSYGTSDLDASTLLMESYGFITANDPRFISTVKATERELCNNGLMYRYKNKDDFGLPSSSFTICSFWFINSLYKIGEKEKSKRLFDQLLSYSNHLGLFSEDIDFDSKRLLGNFPQAYSHLALIETAANFSGGLTKEEEVMDIIHHDQ